ncbi:hypothetical protein QAD02_007833 [Eretmocerus hayati]|uniref:Uncharacterized protein n=1 Tax=Eretmocerus hayati TaxID=131215 RepID=A0ACC2N522_9HYME|nr:hypothetical protein QAD02_007833 [Eretmocerus hayati]
MDTRCANPLGKDDYLVEKSLIPIPKNLRGKNPGILEYAKICLNREFDLQSPSSPEKCGFDGQKCEDASHVAGVTVFDQIKEKSQISTDKQERLLLLTLAQKFWSLNDLVEEFGCTGWEARQSKLLANEHGILSHPAKKRGKVLSNETIKLVKEFYIRDDISRLMPGMSDTISVRGKDGKRENIQERLFFCNLDELYPVYTREFPNVRIALPVPVDIVSEEAQECTDKVVKRARPENSRCCDIESSNQDVFKHLLIPSDPWITSLRSRDEKAKQALSHEAQAQMVKK